MSESVLAIWRLHPAPERGDVFVVNDPALGGSHLPDITVVTPVHDRAGDVVAFVASRGHHADVGGTTPGSMPADSRRLEEEGVVLRGERVVSRGVFARDALLERLAAGPYPARAPQANVADLEAQIAANQRGLELLAELLDQRGVELVARYMDLILDYAEQRVRALIASLPAGSRRCVDRMDDGTCVAVEVTVRDVSKVGAVLKAATDAGANNVWGVPFEIADPHALRAKAREQAIARAKQNAQELARLAGVQLGAIVAVSESDSGMPMPMMKAMRAEAAQSADVPIEQGEIAVTMNVQLFYALQGERDDD